MPAAATFEYDHVAGEATAHITGATIGQTYRFTCFDPSSFSQTQVAATTSFDIVVTGIGGFGAGEQTFAAIVDNTTTDATVGVTVFDKDADGEFTFEAVWDYDGANEVSVTFFAATGVEYELDLNDDGHSETGAPFTGAGASHMLTTTKTGAPFTGSFYGELYTNVPDYNDQSTRRFTPGEAGEGVLGNPTESLALVATGATSITRTSARLNGTANPQGIGIFAWFEYGLTTSYGHETPHVYVGDGNDPVDVSAFVSGLIAGRTYHYRVAAEPGSLPPPGTYGNDLPDRLPASTGTVRNVSSDAQLVTAWAASAPGDIVNVTADIDGSGASRNLSNSGAAGATLTLRCNAGKKIHNYHEFVISGDYVRVTGLDDDWFEITGNGSFGTTDGIKIDGQHVDLNRLYVHDNIGSGIQVGSPSDYLQIWNSKITRNGSNANLDHGIYWSHSGTNCVLGNCLIWDNWAYNVQAYSHTPYLIVTCCTIDGGESHGGDSRGGVVAGDSPATHDQNYYGCIVTNAPNAAGWHYNGSTTVSNYVYDAVAYSNAGGDFGSGFTYTNCESSDPLYVNRGAADFHLQAGSPAIGKIDPSRYGFVPETDIDGTPRVTADCGCYAA